MSTLGSNWDMLCPSSGSDSEDDDTPPYSRPLTMAHLLRKNTQLFTAHPTPSTPQSGLVLASPNSSDSEFDVATPPSTPGLHTREPSPPPPVPPPAPDPYEPDTPIPASPGLFVPFVFGQLQIQRMPGDGNCLFHSLALIDGSGGMQHTYRAAAAAEIRRQDASWFAAYIAPDWRGSCEEYCQYIAQDGHWGGEQEIALLAARLGVQLWVFDVRVEALRPIRYNAGAVRMIGVLVFTGNHYDTVVYLSGGHNGISLFPPGCGERLEEAVVKLLRLELAFFGI